MTYQNCCLFRKVRIFADDTVIFFECQNQNQLSEIIEDTLKNLNDWFVTNKLTMNVEISKFCIFRSQKIRTNLFLTAFHLKIVL